MEYRITTTLSVTGREEVVTVGSWNVDRETALRDAQADIESGIELADGTPILREITFDKHDAVDSSEAFDIIGDPEHAELITLGTVRYDVATRDLADSVCTKLRITTHQLNSMYVAQPVGGFVGAKVAESIAEEYNLDMSEPLGAQLLDYGVLTADEAEWFDEN